MGKKFVNVKVGFQNIHDILQCFGVIDYTNILIDKPNNIKNINWFDGNHNHSKILKII